MIKRTFKEDKRFCTVAYFNVLGAEKIIYINDLDKFLMEIEESCKKKVNFFFYF